jgi:hypothetical protein
LNATVQTYYNALYCIPLCIICALIFGEFPPALNYDYTPTFILALMASAACGISITFSQLLCNTYNSPITTTITMNVKDLAGTVVSILLFSDIILTPMFVIGLAISLFGAAWYSYFKYKEQKAAEEREKNKLLKT